MKKITTIIIYFGIFSYSSFSLALGERLTLEKFGGAAISGRLLRMEESLNSTSDEQASVEKASSYAVKTSDSENSSAAENPSVAEGLGKVSAFQVNRVLIDVGLVMSYGIEDIIEIEVSPFFGATFRKVGQDSE